MKLAAAFAAMLASTATAHAAAFFTTNFSGSSLDPNLQAYGPATWSTGVSGTGSFSGAQVLDQTSASGGDSSRSYIETTATDFNTANFTLKLTYSQSCCDSPTGLVFIGIGNPAPLDGNHEPATGVFMRLHPGDYSYADGLVSHNSGDDTSYGGFSVGGGEHTAEIVKAGNLLNFYMDAANNGTFVQFGSTIDLSLPAFSYLDSSDSRLFFGTGDTLPQFASLSITGSTSVPEPASMVLLGAGLIGLATARRTRRSGATSTIVVFDPSRPGP